MVAFMLRIQVFSPGVVIFWRPLSHRFCRMFRQNGSSIQSHIVSGGSRQRITTLTMNNLNVLFYFELKVRANILQILFSSSSSPAVNSNSHHDLRQTDVGVCQMLCVCY